MKKKLLIVFLICCIMFGVASPAFAYNVADIDINTLPAPPDDYGSYYVFLNANNAYIEAQVFSVQPIILVPSEVGGYYYLSSTDGTNFQTCNYRWMDTGDGLTWFKQNNKTDFSVNAGTLPPLGANFNLLNQDGEPFFPRAPLVEETVGLMKETETIIPILVGNLQILLPFGVGCLTLLMGYLLLSKVLRKFLT